ncbi:TATA box-binding protein-associated factor RNA polymerase I subunit B isoform X2 [Diospyros lotus]|uniref:TATA box-binding protein-associated factor RNA polymerase I subunit B isoform X2 n=1 Tax=Diospyros lotus TaxID=55363 RepID=UPI00225BC41A|nr:TATA box-binding protein-associated factor RNA polymerase I subunit B isoform X2 [Diospyros lotus]
MTDELELTCHACGNVGFSDGSDGFFYCLRCGSQAEDIIDTAINEEDLVNKGDAGGGGGIYLASHRRPRPATVIKVEPLSQSQPQSQFWESIKALENEVKKEEAEAVAEASDGVGPTGPSDFGSTSRLLSYDDYYSEIRMRYVMGLQIMIELQCKALVEKFRVSPVICGLAGTIWLRFVASTRVFHDDWADEAIHESESQQQGQADEFEPHAKYNAEPHNIHGQRAVMIWYRSLAKKIPLSHTLTVAFLVCHLAREAVLPPDIIKWSLEGKLPYFAAFVEIEKQIGPPSGACPLSSTLMFKPSDSVPLQKLESQAASIAKEIGLELPPVNFYAIAGRYIAMLSLPVEKILPTVCQIYEWSLPPELWLSENEFRFPTRVCVMSMVIVAVRILYNINGFGYWEKSLSGSIGSFSGHGPKEQSYNTVMRDDAEQGLPSPSLNDIGIHSSKTPSNIEETELDAVKLLYNLEARCAALEETYDYSEDLPTYLQYCKDVVFAGLEPSFGDLEEEKIIEELLNFYQDQMVMNADSRTSDDQAVKSRDDVTSSAKKRQNIIDDSLTYSPSTDVRSPHTDDSWRQSTSIDDCTPSGSVSIPAGQTCTVSPKDKAIRRMKSNMEENRFCYIPPRVKVKRLDYLHYVRKKDEGGYTYAAHADYYILLRSCARVARVDIRIMHAGVLGFERRLGWLEKRVDHCLNLRPQNDSCEFVCEDIQHNTTDDSIKWLLKIDWAGLEFALDGVIVKKFLNRLLKSTQISNQIYVVLRDLFTEPGREVYSDLSTCCFTKKAMLTAYSNLVILIPNEEIS